MTIEKKPQPQSEPDSVLAQRPEDYATRAGDSPVLWGLFSWSQLLFVWLPIALVTVAHYSSPSTQPWIHDILRRVYYVPIFVAALQRGLPGGLGSALVVTVLYVPHAFMGHAHSLELDPARGTEKILEILLYFGTGTLAGVLAGRERRERRRQETLAHRLRDTLREMGEKEAEIIEAGRLATLGEITAGVAHEVRNPLHSMRSTAEIVRDALPDDSAERRMLGLHLEEIDRLDEVASRFLAFAKPTSEGTQRIALHEVVNKAVALVGARLRKQRVKIEVNQASSNVTVKAHPGQLVQVFMNILLNALRALEDTQAPRIVIEISIHGQEKDERARIRIENNGPAIPKPLLEKIFQPFVSGHESTGLGLSVAKRIIHGHNGDITVENLQIRGVALQVYLPVLNEQ